MLLKCCLIPISIIILRHFLYLLYLCPQVFSCEFCEISKNIFFAEHLWTTVFELCEFFELILSKYQCAFRKFHNASYVDVALRTHWEYQKVKQLIKQKNTTDKLFLLFQNKSNKINSDKFHLLLSNKKGIEINICNEKVSNFYSRKVLGVTIESKIRFEEHVENLCKRARC